MIPEIPLHPEGDVWICDECKLIGTHEQAEAHARAEGHEVARVPDEVAIQVRQMRLRQHDEFVAALSMLGGMNRRVASSRTRHGDG